METSVKVTAGEIRTDLSNWFGNESFISDAFNYSNLINYAFRRYLMLSDRDEKTKNQVIWLNDSFVWFIQDTVTDPTWQETEFRCVIIPSEIFEQTSCVVDFFSANDVLNEAFDSLAMSDDLDDIVVRTDVKTCLFKSKSLLYHILKESLNGLFKSAINRYDGQLPADSPANV